jgi:deoxyribose-phosphate aldolase
VGGASYIKSDATAVKTSTGLWSGASTFNAVTIANIGFNAGTGSVIVTKN